MQEELQRIKQNLKKKETKVKQQNIQTLQPEFSEQKQNSIRTQFFDSGAQNWFQNLEKLTFPTDFIDLPKEQALEIVNLSNIITNDKIENEQTIVQIIKNSNLMKILENNIQNQIESHKTEPWKKVFVKLSTRSPKDSKIILQKSKFEYNQIPNLQNLSSSEKIEQFASIVQNNFSVSNALQALIYFLTSSRVKEDLEYALEGDYQQFNMKIVIRQWKQTIPISYEFRGFVQNGQLNALGQYYHTLYFKNLQNKEEEVKNSIQNYYLTKVKDLIPQELQNCIIDFAYFDKNDIIMIEINPFDGESLGCYPGSTGLFDWDNPTDKNIIEKGPLELRIRKEENLEQNLKHKLNIEWRDIIFPPKHILQ